MSDTQRSDDDVMCAAGTEPCPCAVAALERAAELEAALVDLKIKMAGSSREYESLLAEARTELSAVIDAAEEWAEYVTEDNAPRTISAHIKLAIDAARKP